jgi:hypothetical protein
LENVTSDKNSPYSCQESLNIKENVATERLSQQYFQPMNDKSDICDEKINTLPNLIGKTVRKRERNGWKGTVQSVDTTMATVLWIGDPSPAWVPLRELEVIDNA